MSLPEPLTVPGAPGATFLAEIRAQPAALRALLEHWAANSRRDVAVFRNLAIRVRKDRPQIGLDPDLIVVSVGSFADQSFPPPTESGYDSRRHPWVGLPDSVSTYAPELWWDSARPLYDAGRYAEAADRGRELIEGRPDPYLYYNTACCESLAGRTADAVEHLRGAIDMWEGCRDMARQDSDFDPIRDEPAFEELIGR